MHLSLRLPPFIFHANFGHFIPDNYDPVGAGGADAAVVSERGVDGRGIVVLGKEEEVGE